jgi:hypothetical protein
MFRTTFALLLLTLASTAGAQSSINTTTANVDVKLGDSTTSKFRIFNSDNAELLRVTATGNVAIGTFTERAKLTLRNTASDKYALHVEQERTIAANSGAHEVAVFLTGSSAVQQGVTNAGSITGSQTYAWNTGRGTLGYATAAQFFAGVPASFHEDHPATVHEAKAIEASVTKGFGTVVTGYGIYINAIEATNSYGLYQRSALNANYLAGNTGIGGAPSASHKLHVQGNAHFTGVVTGGEIHATYQDVAEWVPSAEELAPGTVVVLDPSIGNSVLASSRAYDTTVAGVVSAQPGILLGIAGDDKEQIATTGRVRVRVDARKAPIRIGDLLVTSDQPGTAMRSQPLEISGRAFHQPGTILGKALEPLDGGVGEILVLLSLQ